MFSLVMLGTIFKKVAVQMRVDRGRHRQKPATNASVKT